MKKPKLNLVELARKGRFLPGRVSLPDADQEEIDRHRAFVDWQVAQRKGFLVAMLSARKPFANRPVPARRRKRTTAHVARKRTIAARSAYLKERAS